MSNGRSGSQIPIGTTLREARTRLGMDINEAEVRTKIRTRYIRALENEDWEVLPGAVYIRGFLRAYGQVLGLDGELLADEYRRHHEQPAEPAPPTSSSESLLSGRRPPGERPSSRTPLVAGLLVAFAALLLLLGLLGGGDSSDDDGNQNPRQERRGGDGAGGGGAKKGSKKKGGSGGGSSGLKQEKLEVNAFTSVDTVCLVADRGRALIDSQTLSTGDRESFDGAKRYRLDLAGGSLALKIGGERERIDATEPVSIEADSDGIREVDYRGPDCP